MQITFLNNAETHLHEMCTHKAAYIFTVYEFRNEGFVYRHTIWAFFSTANAPL